MTPRGSDKSYVPPAEIGSTPWPRRSRSLTRGEQVVEGSPGQFDGTIEIAATDLFFPRLKFE
jgi:hypothetical protein